MIDREDVMVMVYICAALLCLPVLAVVAGLSVALFRWTGGI